MWRLAFRNLRRQQRRSSLTLGMLAVGFVALALAGGFMSQTFHALSEGAIRGGLGHLQVLDPRSLDGDGGWDPALGLPHGEALAAQLRRDPAVAEVLPRLEFMGLLSAGGRSVAALATAVDPVREAAHMSVPERMAEGAKAPGGSGSRWLGAGPREAVLGIGLARALGVGVGDEVTLLATTSAGALNALDLQVVGLQDLGLKELNDRALALSLVEASSLLETGEARSRLSLVLRHPERLRRELQRLKTGLDPSLDLRPWQDQAAFYQQVRLLYVAIFGFLGLVLGLVVVLAVASALLMSVMERLREFGTLRAIGLAPGRLVLLLQAEAAVLGLGGSLLGLGLTLAIRAGLNALHLQLPPPPGTSHGYELSIQFVPGVYLGVALALQAVVQIAALMPGLRAARLKVVEALRAL